MRNEHLSLTERAEPVPIDFSAMVATMLAGQKGSPAASAQIHHDVACRVAHSREEAMTTLMHVRPGWPAAAAALGGSFHPGIAARLGAKGL